VKQHKFWYNSILGICLKLLKTSGAFLLNSKTLDEFYLSL
jgi:hypothetical protein